MNINFSRNGWNTDEITYAYSNRFEQTPVFEQLEHCVQNCENSDAKYGFDNISLLTRKKFSSHAKITTRCAFEELGAPLIVIADKLYTDERSVMRYGDYLEVVLYREGVNIWRMKMQDKKVTWKLLMSVSFPVTEDAIHTLEVEIEEDMLFVKADGKRMALQIDEMYPSYHLGINACEGINRFFDLNIEE